MATKKQVNDVLRTKRGATHRDRKKQPTRQELKKVCSMNCGPRIGETRTREEMMEDCEDCYQYRERADDNTD